MHPVLANLSDTLNTAFRDHDGFASSMSGEDSVSITVLSTDAGNTPLFDFHYSSSNLNESAGSTLNVTQDSVYRIGSISKLFTAYMLLVNYGWEHWDKPVTDFIPELRGHSKNTNDAIDSVDWDEVTIGSLASHLSGIGRDFSNGDLASQDFPREEAGLPKLPSKDVPDCAGNSTLPPCNRKGKTTLTIALIVWHEPNTSRVEYFEGFIQRHPIFATHSTPVYSNAAYRILGYVLERLSGKSYHDLLQSSVVKPLRLSGTGTERPTAHNVPVIPNGDSAWFQDTGDEAPTAGLYSSSLDLARFGQAVLQNRQLSPAITRRWMKPTSHTASLSLSIGSPWEIHRTRSNITNGRVIDLYTKSGSLGRYNSLLVLIPDFQITFSILTAGITSSPAIKVATELVTSSLLPALEKISGIQACENLCGTYASTTKQENSSISITADEKGLLVKSWISQGVDIQQVAQGMVEDGEQQAIRLQVTNLHTSTSSHGKKSGHVSYRALFMTTSKGNNFHILDDAPEQWSGVDSVNYGNVAADDFVFSLNQDGKAANLEVRILRETFKKQK
ncbi:hypothetical protein LRP88_15020 [Fusarium phalaenopsidis]